MPELPDRIGYGQVDIIDPDGQATVGCGLAA
jgi:hypothetical protein